MGSTGPMGREMVAFMVASLLYKHSLMFLRILSCCHAVIKRGSGISGCCAPPERGGTRRSLFLARAHATDFVLSGQAEGIQHAGGLLWEVSLEVHRDEQGVARADVDPPARH